MHAPEPALTGHPAALGGVLVLVHSCLDLKSTLLDKTHYLLYYLTCAMNPRMLTTSTRGRMKRSRKADESGEKMATTLIAASTLSIVCISQPANPARNGAYGSNERRAVAFTVLAAPHAMTMLHWRRVVLATLGSRATRYV